MMINQLHTTKPMAAHPKAEQTSVLRFALPGFCGLFILLLAITQSLAQSPLVNLEPMPLFTPPRQYTTPFANLAPVIDGHLNDPAWQSAPWSDAFVDIEGNKQPVPALGTRMKMVWNDTCLFIAAELQEPQVWATLRQPDEVVFYDNDFEVFIDPDNNTHQYYEIEVNALNTIFDLFLAKPYRNNGQAMIHWNVEHFRSAVQVQGTLNNPLDKDKGWTVEMAIPFRSVSLGNSPQIPQEGTLWRINFSRVEWDTEVKEGKYLKKTGANGRHLPEHNWVWSPQGLVDMHYPERWGYLKFTRQNMASNATAFVLPYAEKQKRYLWLIYYRQKKYYEKHQRYAATLAELEMNNSQVLIDKQTNELHLEAGKYQFTASIESPNQTTWSINQDGLVQLLNKPQ
jgi:hypothetical protein